MYILIALLTMTTLGTYPTQARCEDAVRQIYSQKIDPYNLISPAQKKEILDIQMKYKAPKEYRCQKI
jgi:hypothetical protein